MTDIKVMEEVIMEVSNGGGGAHRSTPIVEPAEENTRHGQREGTSRGLIVIHHGPLIFMGAFVIDYEFERIGSDVGDFCIRLLPDPCLSILPSSVLHQKICKC
jgi:hypothetical protein